MHIFVISLERSIERRSALCARLRSLGLSAEIFPAIDGASLAPDQAHYDGRRRRLLYGKDMTSGEIGCARSHVAVCTEIVRRNLSGAIVLEDDAILADHLPAAITALSGAADKWDLVRFLGSEKNLRLMRRVNDLGNGFALTRIYGTPGGAYGYALNRRAAQRLARCGATTWMPIDTLHGQVWRHGLRVRGLIPSPALPDYVVPSTIGSERFSKVPRLAGWERAVFPVTRYAFKLWDAAMKKGTFWLGLVKDRLHREH